MSAHDKLEHQLRASVRSAAAGTRAARRRPWSWSRRLSGLIMALSSATVVAVAVIALVVLHHGRSPSPTPTPPATTHHGSRFGPPPPDPGPIPDNVDDAVVAASWNTAWRQDPACRPAGGQGPGSGVTNATPSSAMLSALPELRRPATSADRLPANLYKRFGGRLTLLVGGPGGDVYVRYVRRVRVAEGRIYYLIPVANLGRPPCQPRPPIAAIASRSPRSKPSCRASRARNAHARADTVTPNSRSAATTSKPRPSTKEWACSPKMSTAVAPEPAPRAWNPSSRADRLAAVVAAPPHPNRDGRDCPLGRWRRHPQVSRHPSRKPTAPRAERDRQGHQQRIHHPDPNSVPARRLAQHRNLALSNRHHHQDRQRTTISPMTRIFGRHAPQSAR